MTNVISENIEMNKVIKEERKNFLIKFSQVKIRFAKEKLKSDPNCQFSIIVSKKNNVKNSRETHQTEERQVMETIISLSETFKFTNVDIINDTLEVQFKFISGDKLTTKFYDKIQYKISELFKELVSDKSKSCFWALNEMFLIEATYSFQTEVVMLPKLNSLYKQEEELKILKLLSSNNVIDEFKMKQETEKVSLEKQKSQGQSTNSIHLRIKKVESSIVKKDIPKSKFIQESSISNSSNTTKYLANIESPRDNKNNEKPDENKDDKNDVNARDSSNEQTHKLPNKTSSLLATNKAKITTLSSNISNNNRSSYQNFGKVDLSKYRPPKSINNNNASTTTSNTVGYSVKSMSINYNANHKFIDCVNNKLTTNSKKEAKEEVEKKTESNNKGDLFSYIKGNEISPNINKQQNSIDNSDSRKASLNSVCYTSDIPISNINLKDLIINKSFVSNPPLGLNDSINKPSSDSIGVIKEDSTEIEGSIKSIQNVASSADKRITQLVDSPENRGLNRKASFSKIKEEGCLRYKRESSCLNINTSLSVNRDSKETTDCSSKPNINGRPPINSSQFKKQQDSSCANINKLSYNSPSPVIKRKSTLKNPQSTSNSNENINQTNVNIFSNLNLSSCGNEGITSLNQVNSNNQVLNLRSMNSNEKQQYQIKKLLSTPLKRDSPKRVNFDANMLTCNQGQLVNGSSSINNNDSNSSMQKQQLNLNNSNSNNNLPPFKNPFSNVDFIELNYEDYFEYQIGDNFIEAIFLAGLPKSGNKMIVCSEAYLAPCGHKECSCLNAYKPDILFKFPLKGRETIAITNLSASLCFTRGIKLCFSPAEKEVPLQEDFINVMTNEALERFYMVNYHFYVKQEYIKFQQEFDCNPIKDASYLKNPNISSDYLMMISELHVRDFVYIPYCMCFIVKFPYKNQIYSTIESLIQIAFKDRSTSNSNDKAMPFKDKNNILSGSNYINSTSLSQLNLKTRRISDEKLLIEFIKHITYEIPIPEERYLLGKKLKIFLPYVSTPIEIAVPENRLPLTAYNINAIFDFLSLENLTVIFHLLLHEERVLLIGKSQSVLSLVLDNLKNILYPIKWNNVYIPVLSEDMINFLQCFMPFIMGLEESLYFLAKPQLDSLKDMENYEKKELFIVNLEKNTIETLLKPKKITKKNLKAFINEFDIDEYEKLEACLKEVHYLREKAIKEKYPLNHSKLDKLIIQIFATYLVGIFGEFQKYLIYIDGQACFNRELFIASKNSKYKDFYMDIIDTSNFNTFIQNKPLEHTYFNKLIQRNTGKIVTNTGKANSSSGGIMSIFNKKKHLEVSLQDIIIPSSKKLGFVSNMDMTNSEITVSKDTGNVTSIRDSKFEIDNKKSKTCDLQVTKSNRSFAPTGKPLENNTLIENEISNNINIINKNNNYNNQVPKSVNTSALSNKSGDNTPENSGADSELNIQPFFVKDLLMEFEKIDDYLEEYLTVTPLSPNRVFDFEQLMTFIDKMKTFNEDQEKFNRILIANLKGDIVFNKKNNNSASKSKNKVQNSDYRKNSNSPNNLNEISNDKKTAIFKSIINKDSDKEKENERLKEKIVDFLRNILTSQVISDQDIKTSNTFYLTHFGRKCIAEIIFQSKFNNHKYHQLSEKGFELLKQIISNSLILSNQTEEQLEDIIKCTKACFHYYKLLEKQKKPYYLYYDLVKSQMKIWENEDLWCKWFELEIQQSSQDEDELIQVNNNLDNYYFSKILPLSDIMKDLNLDIKFVLNTLGKLASINIKEELLREELNKSIIKLFNNKNKK